MGHFAGKVLLWVFERKFVEGVGWGGRIRTYGTRYQKPLPYHLATPQLGAALPKQVMRRKDKVGGQPRQMCGAFPCGEVLVLRARGLVQAAIRDHWQGQKMRLAGMILRRGLIFSLVWTTLVGSDPEGWAFGAVAIPAAVWLSLALLPDRGGLRLMPLIAMLPGFITRSVAGGVDVARRAFDPRLPLQPGWLVRPVKLSAGGRVALGAELSLMPGTLVAGSRGTELLVHVLDVTEDHDGTLAAEETRFAAIMGRDDA